MTDLSKELGEIKRRLQETADFESENAREIANKAAFLPECQRLLHIIEVEIPGLLHKKGVEAARKVEPNESRFAQGLWEASHLIESLTKKEKG